MNSRLDPLQASVLREKLRVLDSWNDRRRQLASRYIYELSDTGLILPNVPLWAEPVWHLFVVRHPHREDIHQQLADAGIGTLIHYPIPPHRQLCYLHDHSNVAYPLATLLSSEVLSLPIGPHLSMDAIPKVIAGIKASCMAIVDRQELQ
jgi:dTDP-4-amino-4,6-dideoxygalactose transaminase